jgi:hypothetical protein
MTAVFQPASGPNGNDASAEEIVESRTIAKTADVNTANANKDRLVIQSASLISSV